MPILILSKTFNDNFGNALTYYQSNVGDRQSITLEVETNIRISSIGNPIIIDVSTSQYTSTNESWLQEGFRVGDSINVTKYASDGTTIITWNATINYVDDTIIDISPNQIGGYDIAAGEFIVIKVLGRNRDDLDVLFNHVANGQTGSAASLLDAETTRAIFQGVDSLAVGAAINAILPPNQSGQLVISASIQRLADPPAPNVEVKKIYAIRVDFQTSGFYDQSLYATGNCLKVYMRLEWASISGEPFARTQVIFNDDANTGFLNEAYNTGIAEATMVQGITELDYCTPSTHDIIIDGLVSDLGIGAAYVSLDDSYYKNKASAGQSHLMLAPSSDVFLAPFPWTLISNVNDFGAGYLIDINSVNTIGTQTTINITFTPQPLFTQFMDALDDGDRLFYLWIHAGNVNLTAFSDQLTCAPTPAGPLVLESSVAFLDHDYNQSDYVGSLTDRPFNTEDDIAYYGTFLLEKNDEVDEFIFTMEAYNAVSGDSFTLQTAIFNFSGVQISNDGRYLLNETQNIVSTLPTTSEKRNAYISLFPSIDVGSQYGVQIYYPYLLRWEYWLDQLNANVDFYPDQNKNWFPYDNTGDWEVRLKLQLVKDGLAYEHFEDVNILDYDSEPDIVSDIQLYRVSTGQNVGVVIEGELMKVEATHKLINGNSWDVSGIWGMITIEPTESSPRWIVSSVVPTDNNSNNPLTAINQPLVDITFPSPNLAKMECYFNPDLINLSNGVKFTSKIKGCDTEQQVLKTMTDGTIKTTTTNDIKTLAQ